MAEVFRPENPDNLEPEQARVVVFNGEEWEIKGRDGDHLELVNRSRPGVQVRVDKGQLDGEPEIKPSVYRFSSPGTPVPAPPNADELSLAPKGTSAQPTLEEELPPMRQELDIDSVLLDLDASPGEFEFRNPKNLH